MCKESALEWEDMRMIRPMLRSRPLTLAVVALMVAGLLFATYPHITISPGSGVISISLAQQQTAYARTMNPYLPEVKSPNAILQAGSKYEIVSTRGSKVIIGDSSSAQFEPAIEIQHFNNEAGIRLGLDGVVGNLFPTMTGANLTAGNNAFGFEWLATAPKEGFSEDGGVDWIITLKQKPPTNSLSFTYNSTLVSAFLQPPLTPEEIAEGIIRPDYVVNSIAFYRSDVTSALYPSSALSSKYRTGKIGHLYRMQVKGSTVWADWSLAGNQITLSLPQAFLDTAIYPIVIGPVGDTFGFTTPGATSEWWDPDEMHGYRFTAPANMGTADNITLYSRDSGELRKGVIVLQSTLNIVTDGVSNPITLPTDAAWVSAAFATPPTLSSNTDYVLASVGNASSVLYWDTGTTNYGLRDATNSYTTPTNPTDATLNSNKYSIYVTYTPGSSPRTYAPTANTSSSWTNPQNAWADSSGYAYITSGLPSGNDTWRNYGVSLDAGATIDSVSVRYDAWSAGVTPTAPTRVPTGNGTSSGAYTSAQTRVPTGNGVNSGTWTASDAGNLWAAVDEIDVRGTSGDAVYITSPTNAGGWQLFTFTAFSVPTTATSISVIVYQRAVDDTSGANNIRETIRVGGVSYNGTSHSSATSITVWSNTWATNPKTGAAWTPAQINGTDGTNDLQQFGVSSTDLSPAVRTHLVVAEVIYTNSPFNEVDETSPDDTDYIKGTTDTANFFHFTFTAFSIPTGSTITNLTVYVRARDGFNAAVGTNDARPGLRVNGTNYDGTASTNNPGSTFTTYSYAFTLNPNTGSAWTAEDINGSGAAPLQQFGAASSDGAPDFDVSMVYATVNYIEYDDTISIQVSWDGGTSWSTANTSTVTGTEVTYTANVTGVTSWTVDKLSDANFRVRAYATTSNNAEEVRLDWLPVTVAWTEESGEPEITVSPASYDWGVVGEGSTTNTTTGYFTIDNTSTIQTDQTISVTSTNWTGGNGWGHSETATPGVVIAGLNAQKGGTWGASVVIIKNASPNYIAENQAAGTDYSFGLSLKAPTEFNDGVQKTITVRITAAEG